MRSATGEWAESEHADERADSSSGQYEENHLAQHAAAVREAAGQAIKVAVQRPEDEQGSTPSGISMFLPRARSLVGYRGSQTECPWERV